MWAILIVSAALGGLIIMAIVIGKFLPTAHVATVCEEFPVDAASLWRILTDYEAMPDWRAGLKEVARLEDGAREQWVEKDRRRAIVYETVECRPPHYLVRRIVGNDLPFSGQWKYALEPSGTGAVLRITEEGQVHNAFFRFVSKFIIGHRRTMEGFMRDLRRHAALSK
jgi:uncharacterized protein YndB with AHSA1/START domain